VWLLSGALFALDLLRFLPGWVRRAGFVAPDFQSDLSRSPATLSLPP